MKEFWVASGHHLAPRRPDGWLSVTPELLTAWIARPELAPPEEACAAERALHARLSADPLAPVHADQVGALADPDGRENWELFLILRDHLLKAGSVEGGYLALTRARARTAPLLLDQLTQLILRNALEGCEDVQTLRAAENFFRPQQGFLKDGHLRFVDLELHQELEIKAHAAPLAALFEGGVEALDLLGAGNAWTWWSRSDAHTMIQNFGGDPEARLGMARAIAAFVRHLHRVEAKVSPVSSVEGADFGWPVGLTREGSAIGEALWRGTRPSGRLVGLFRLDFGPKAPVSPQMRGRPVWLLMGLGEDLRLRMKPQNLATGLPLIEEGAAHVRA